MEFSQAQYEKIAEEIRKGLEELPRRADDLMRAAGRVLSAPQTPQVVVRLTEPQMRRLERVSQQVVDKLTEVVQGIAAPLHMFQLSLEWHREIQTKANLVASEIQPNQLLSEPFWHGTAGDRYRVAVSDQSLACQHLQGLADHGEADVQLLQPGGDVAGSGLDIGLHREFPLPHRQFDAETGHCRFPLVGHFDRLGQVRAAELPADPVGPEATRWS